MAVSGHLAILKWCVNALVKAIREAMGRLREQFCANAERIYERLKDRGASVPKRKNWDKLSCDQKIAFVAALGPYGLAMLYTGALAGAWVNDAKGQMKKWGKQAAKASNKIANSIGSGAEKIGEDVSSWTSSAGGAVQDVIDKVF